ncbi:signal peptide peptidase SppA [Candidatus Woesearchaeota archaeon]|nr:signal peptide peptidase SppA [Candidatus Woesearchaeota archaeon]MBW3022104.1 signal peptide peptidase SppA [Candidatus Woesearchaeota archaeon]
MPKKKPASGRWIILTVVIVIVALIIILSSLSKNNLAIGDKVAIIYINGPIAAGNDIGFLSQEGTSSSEVISFIESAEKDPSIKALMFEINSPGGTAVASKEIADKIKSVKKYKIAVIREAGVSGAYWVASACDKIVANDLSIVGSIGVIGSYLEFSGFLDRYNITYQRLVSGKYKDIGSPFKSLTGEEEQKLQSQLDTIHDYFVEEVAANRKIDRQKAAGLATGEFFIGLQALDLGLVDVLGDKDTAEAILKQELNTAKIHFVEYRRKRTIFDIISSVMSEQSYFLGKGIGSELLNLRTNNLDIRI